MNKKKYLIKKLIHKIFNWLFVAIFVTIMLLTMQYFEKRNRIDICFASEGYIAQWLPSEANNDFENVIKISDAVQINKILKIYNVNSNEIPEAIVFYLQTVGQSEKTYNYFCQNPILYHQEPNLYYGYYGRKECIVIVALSENAMTVFEAAAEELYGDFVSEEKSIWIL